MGDRVLSLAGHAVSRARGSLRVGLLHQRPFRSRLPPHTGQVLPQGQLLRAEDLVLPVKLGYNQLLQPRNLLEFDGDPGALCDALDRKSVV